MRYISNRWYIVTIIGMILTGAVIGTTVTAVIYDQKVSTLEYSLDRANDSLEYYRSSPEEQLKIQMRKQEAFDRLDKALSR